MDKEKEDKKLIAEICKILDAPKENLVVHIKYLLFEIEATHREYEELVKYKKRGD